MDARVEDRRHTQIIQCAEDQIKSLHPFDVVLALLDVPMPRPDGNTLGIDVPFSLRPWSRVKMLCKSRRNKGFRFLDICLSEEELTVQVGEVDRVEVDDLDVSESDEDEVFEEFAADAAGADDEELA